MAVVTHDFQKEILDAMKDYSSLARPVKASFLERMFIEKAPVLKLYPNPDDEFTNPEIGPNYEIVGNYVDTSTTSWLITNKAGYQKSSQSSWKRYPPADI